MIIVGFTGTREGLRSKQILAIREFFSNNYIGEGHHGDCIGGDEEFHYICLEYDIPIIGHPPEDEKQRAFCRGFTKIMPPLPYLERNHNIVDAVDLLLAGPKEDYEPPPARGQGTWSTVRYARRSRKEFKIVWPEGVMV